MPLSLTIGLIGYGIMGRAIETVANKQGISVGKIISSEENEDGKAIGSLTMGDVDVLLDFTVPDAVFSNIRAASEKGINIVVGTTGWYDKFEEAVEIVQKNNTGLFYASNFSIGMNILFQLVEKAVHCTNRFPEYDVYVHEIHHNQKKDSPSGSAHTIGEIIVKESVRKKRIETNKLTDSIAPDVMHVSSTRAGSVIGTHLVGFDSDYDSIELKHSAKNRIGFVQGALRAAQWMKGKKGVYTMKDLLGV